MNEIFDFGTQRELRETNNISHCLLLVVLIHFTAHLPLHCDVSRTAICSWRIPRAEEEIFVIIGVTVDSLTWQKSKGNINIYKQNIFFIQVRPISEALVNTSNENFLLTDDGSRPEENQQKL